MRNRKFMGVAGVAASMLSLCIYTTQAQATKIVADNLSATLGGGAWIGFIATPAGFINSAVGQTFTPSAGGILETITVTHSTRWPELNPLVMSFFAAAVQSPTATDITGPALGQVTIPYASIPDVSSPVTSTRYTTDFDFSALNINLVAGSLYGFMLHTATARTGAGQDSVGFTQTSTYAGGNRIIGFNSTASTFGVASSDIPFRVTVASMSIPEPSTLTLLAFGLAGLGFVTRKDKNAGEAAVPAVTGNAG